MKPKYPKTRYYNWVIWIGDIALLSTLINLNDESSYDSFDYEP